ncbi:VCBS repeat-containing protein [Hathewaya histolytica]|uniref:Lipoprotein n=1 Tax=Hathewaya histolytica TaxID=1498 RepID=A0A4U9RVK4_HATHI|nr:VCBS repeat-containing protein [Hathewaya histolytica]VTQ95686.1 lipoprotein [Hathewaya histolytica]
MNKRLLSIIVFIFSIILSGCSIIELPNNLITKPSSYISKQKLDPIMSLLLKEGKTLTIAMGDSERKSIREVDLDNDGKNEIILLYKKDNNYYNNYGVMILKQKDNVWEVINNITFSCKNIDIVDYKDITGDGKPEILVGVNSSDKNNNTLFIYSYHRGFYETLGNFPYSNLQIYDIDGDNKNELITFNTTDDKSKTSSILKLYKFNDIKPTLLDSFELNRAIVSSKMTIGKASKDINGIFLNLNLDNKSFYTDLFILKNGKLKEVLENEKNLDVKKIKTYQRYENPSKSLNIDDVLKDIVKDINSDGILEIGYAKSNNSNLNIYTPSNLMYWNQWDENNGLSISHREYYNADYKYRIGIPLSLGMNFKILQNVKEENTLNRVDFLTGDYTNKNNLLFSIKIYSKDQWALNQTMSSSGDYVILKEDEDRFYVGFLNNKLVKSNLTLDYIKDVFKPIE